MTATQSTATHSTPTPAPTRPARSGTWRTVARREVMTKVTDRAFLIGTGFTLVLLAAVIVLQILLGGRATEWTVAVTDDPSATVVEGVAAAAPEVEEDSKVTTSRVADDAAAEAALRDGDADAWLHQDGDGWALTTLDEPDPQLQTVTDAVLRQQALATNAAAAGTTADALLAGSTLTTDQLEGDPGRANLIQAMGFVFAMLFYIAALTFGMTLAGSVIEEKQSRIVEIIAAAIPLRQLLAGKVVGNTLIAAAQMVLYVVVGVVGLSFTEFSNLLPSISGSVVWFLVFFVAGFVALSCMWAVAGALCSRNEDLQSTSTPITVLILAMFFGSLFLDGTIQTVLSFVPPVSAILMPIRLLSGDVAWWEPVTAMVLLLAFAGVMIVLGERIYRRALLQTGGKLSLRKAWSLEE